jgi:hypothetical protein
MLLAGMVQIARHLDSEVSVAESPPASGTMRERMLREAAVATDDGPEGRKFGDCHVDSLFAHPQIDWWVRTVEKVSVALAAAGFPSAYQPEVRSATARLRKGDGRNKEGGASRIDARRSL